MFAKKSGRLPSSSRSNQFPYEIPKQIENFESTIDRLFPECGIARHEYIAEFEEV